MLTTAIRAGAEKNGDGSIIILTKMEQVSTASSLVRDKHFSICCLEFMYFSYGLSDVFNLINWVI